MGFHKDAPLADIHRAHAFEYANEAARLSASGFTSADLHKIAIQLDLNTVWLLTSTTPTWEPVAGAGTLTTDQKAAADGANSPSASNVFITAQDMTDKASDYQVENTGYVSGLIVSINADPTKFDISSGVYHISTYADPSNPLTTEITYAGITGVTVTYLASHNATYIGLDVNGAVVQSSTPFTNVQRRSIVTVGAVIHTNRTSINVTNEIKAPLVASTNQLHDFIKAVGSLNLTGNIYTNSGANLKLNKSSGIIWALGVNASDITNPHQLTIASQTALTFRYRLQNGTEYADTTDLNPTQYDLNGVLTAVENNKYTIQHINLFQSGLTRIQYGQRTYASMAAAKLAVQTESFVVETNIADNSIFRCYFIVKKEVTNLSTSIPLNEALFVPVDKFGGVQAGAGIALTADSIAIALGYVPVNPASPTFTGLTTIDHIVMPKEQGHGIQVDIADPTWAWRDLEGVELIDMSGLNAATLNIYNAPIRDFSYGVNDIKDIRFHMPHDYVSGTDMYIHVHWSHNGTGITGNFAANFNYTYAKGHNQQIFSAPKTVSVSYPTVNIDTTPQYIHRIEEVIFTTPIPGGTATLVDNATLEVDGLILVNYVQTAIPTITGGVVEPFIHRVDIHYQSSNMGTKQKSPDFWV